MPDTDKMRVKAKKPAAQQKQASGEAVLRARPVEGDVDRAMLTRRIIARFPKILAALAKRAAMAARRGSR